VYDIRTGVSFFSCLFVFAWDAAFCGLLFVIVVICDRLGGVDGEYGQMHCFPVDNLMP
jgi:hypothetical protein